MWNVAQILGYVSEAVDAHGTQTRTIGMSSYQREMKHTCVLYYFPHAACFTYLQPSEIAQAPALS